MRAVFAKALATLMLAIAAALIVLGTLAEVLDTLYQRTRKATKETKENEQLLRGPPPYNLTG